MTWQKRRVSELAFLFNGFPFDAATFSSTEQMPLVRIRDLLADEFETYIPTESAPEGVLVRDDDVLVGMDGDFNVKLWHRGTAALNQRLCALRSRPGCDPRFLAYALPRQLKVINDLTYATTVKHLSSWQVAHITFWAPDVHEQRAIADFLDEQTSRIDTLINKQTRLISTLRERQGAFIAATTLRGTDRTARLVDSGHPWLGLVPEHWSIDPLGVHFVERKEQVNDRDYAALSVTKGGVVAQLATAAKTDNNDARKLVRAGDFVINSRSDRKGSAGVSTMDGSTSVVYIVLQPRPSMHGAYIHHLLRSIPFQEEFYRWGNGIVADLWSTRYSAMRRIALPVPPVSEQRQIAGFLNDRLRVMNETIATAERHIMLAQERRAALITAAVTGQIDVGTTGRAA